MGKSLHPSSTARSTPSPERYLVVNPANHCIVAAKVSLEDAHDFEVLPTQLNPLRRTLGTVYADGADDTKVCHELIQHKGATACIPPRKNAGLWEEGHPRKDAVLVMWIEGCPTARGHPVIIGCRWRRLGSPGSSS